MRLRAIEGESVRDTEREGELERDRGERVSAIESEREIERDSATRLLQTLARMARVMRHSFKLSHAIHQTFARILAAGAGHGARPIQTIARGRE